MSSRRRLHLHNFNNLKNIQNQQKHRKGLFFFVFLCYYIYVVYCAGRLRHRGKMVVIVSFTEKCFPVRQIVLYYDKGSTEGRFIFYGKFSTNSNRDGSGACDIRACDGVYRRVLVTQNKNDRRISVGKP